MNSETVRKKHQDYLFPAVKNYYKESVAVARAKGARVEDMEGNSYLDFFGGILTVSVGHANEDVNREVITQINNLTHVSSLYPTFPVVELAEKLVNLAPGKLDKCFFTASGTEADETAVMMAQLYTGNYELIALRHGYSGRSLLAQSLTAHASWRALPTQVAAVKHALSPYCYRCPLKLTYPECGVACAEDVEELIQTTTTGQIAGILVEPIQGVGGFITPPPEYFKIVAEIVRNHGGIFISDEDPDMITAAKGIANGMPLAAVVTTSDIAATLTKNTISTFGGNPVSCAAAKATINVIQRDELDKNAEEMGDILRKGLEQLQEKYPRVIGEVRGMGLMQAIELVVDETKKDRTTNPAAAEQLMEETKARGLLIGRGGLYANAMRISPPLNITRSEVEEAIGILNDSFAAID